MRQRIRFWLKLSAAVGLPVVIFIASSSSPSVQDLVIGLKTMAIEAFGNADQHDRLVEQTGRIMAVRNGSEEMYEKSRAFYAAVESQRRLAAIDEQLADQAIIVAQQEREERQLAAAR